VLTSAAILPQAGGCGNQEGLTGCLKPHHASQDEQILYHIDNLTELSAIEAGAATQIGQIVIHIRRPLLGKATARVGSKINVPRARSSSGQRGLDV
jgi:hypothetical protein